MILSNDMLREMVSILSDRDELSATDVSLYDYLVANFDLSKDMMELITVSFLMSVLVFFIIKMDFSFLLGFILTTLILFAYLLHIKHRYDEKLNYEKTILFNKIDMIKGLVTEVCGLDETS